MISLDEILPGQWVARGTRGREAWGDSAHDAFWKLIAQMSGRAQPATLGG